MAIGDVEDSWPIDAGGEVLKVVSAIVTAFSIAADTLDAIRTRKDGNQRKLDHDVEELLKMKILWKSLSEGKTLCRRHCDHRRQKCGEAFCTGDAIALPALKEVVFVLQAEIVQPLLLARDQEDATVDSMLLHETSITCRTDATRIMDSLCQRISASFERELIRQVTTAPAPSFSSGSERLSILTTLPDTVYVEKPRRIPPSTASFVQAAGTESTVSGEEEADELIEAEAVWLSPRIDKVDEDELTRASAEAPETHRRACDAHLNEKLRPLADLDNEKFPACLTQADYQDRLLTLPKGQENVWLPLSRPAMHNRYHGFCKGAWQIRRAAHDGLQVELTPAPKEPILHWQCTACKFRSKAPNADALPDHILFNQKYNVRYRWLFLAKSHRSANSPCDNPENYKYGCIFCAAIGNITAEFERFEHLLVHIMSKHKTPIMDPEIQAKTKCTTGGIAVRKQDWDVMLPDGNNKVTITAADELLMAASKMWSRRKSRNKK